MTQKITLSKLIANDPNIWNDKKGLFGYNEKYTIYIKREQYLAPTKIKLYNEKDYNLYVMEYMLIYVYYYKKIDKNTLFVKVVKNYD